MSTFLLTLAVIACTVLAMSIGVLCGRRPLGRGCARGLESGGACAGCERRRRSDDDRA